MPMPTLFRNYRCLVLIFTYTLVLSLFGVYYVWQLTRDNTKPFVFEEDGGAFMDLATSFLHGQTSMMFNPDPKFADLKNPYVDRGEVPTPWDYSYYRKPGEKIGKFYLYFQPAPVLLFYYPYYFHTGSYPSQRWIMFLLSFADLLFYALLLRILVRNHFPNVPAILEALLITMYGLCNMNNYLQVTVQTYQLDDCCAMTFTMACLLFLYLAVGKGNYRIVWLALASISSGIAFGSRPPYVFIGVLLVLTWLWLFWKDYKFTLPRFFILESIFLFVPTLLCYFASAWYNYARFDDIFEFGIAYQLNGGEYQRYHHFLLSYIPDSIWRYFLQPWHPIPHFPFVDIEDQWGNDFDFLWKGRFRLACTGMLPAFPICLLGFVWPMYFKMQMSDRSRFLFLAGLMTVWTLIMTALMCTFFSIIHRYMAEILFPLLLLTTMTLLMRRQISPFRVWEKIVLSLLFTYSFYFGIVYGLTGETEWIIGKLQGIYHWQ